jgi:hypothetical protein
MEILFLLTGVAFVAVGIAVVLSEVRDRRGTSPIAGEVIGFSLGARGGSGGSSYYPVAEYVGSDGQRRFVEGSVGSSAPLHAVGDAITILVRPDQPEKAVFKSPLTYVLGAALAAMGSGSCVAFFAVFRPTTFSIASAACVVLFAAHKLRQALREKPMAFQEWRKMKERALRPRVFTEATKALIVWADPVALQNAVASQRRMNRFAVPVLLLAGGGLLWLGVHLHTTTATFLQTAVPSPGIVVALATNASSDGDTYAPVVEFEAGGRTYRFKDSVSSNPPSYRRGDPVRVLHDPADPANARIDRGLWNKAIPILVAVFGALLCLVGVWMLKRRASTATAGQGAIEPI